MRVNTNYIFVAVIGFFLFLVGRSLGRAKEKDTSVKVGTIPKVQSSLPDDQVQALAEKLRSIFDEWYVDTGDEVRILNIWRSMTDSGSVRKLYAYFGTFTTLLYGGGDLDYWMKSRVSETVRNQCAAFGFGLTNF